ncbi:hypothetical protein NU09_2015 [Flavobacterium beibuense]|uniref:Uncharacterized protein n=1 Tax=Flavobacterium beibuense TaxID=657326 RepID=A0A444WAT0_9FLAO|nr:hypothetical protein NU09_2015 [Flavobacterium beibuense]
MASVVLVSFINCYVAVLVLNKGNLIDFAVSLIACKSLSLRKYVILNKRQCKVYLN